MKIQSPPLASKLLGLQMSLKASISISAAITLLTGVAYVFFSLHHQEHLAGVLQDLLGRRMEAMHAAQQVKVSLVAHDDALFRYLATRDEDQYAECLQERESAQTYIRQLDRFSESPYVRSRLQLLQQESDRYFQDAEGLLAFSSKNRLPENAGLFTAAAWALDQNNKLKQLEFLSAGGKTRLIRVFSLCDELVTLHRTALEEAQRDIQEQFRQSRRSTLRWGALAAGFILLIALRLALSLVMPLKNLLAGIERAQAGDLSMEIPLLSLDEIGRITMAFNQMTHTVREQKERLLQETITDGLTGIYNQRHFRHLLKQEFDRARRSQRPVCVMMIDVDYFKTYNDTQGHEAGNELLKRICSMVREHLRESDAFARYGGDELSLILPDTLPADAQVLAHKLQGAILATRFPGGESMPAKRVTLSMGGASFPDDAKSANDLVAKADEALYAAKQSGRACVRWASRPFLEKNHAA